MQALWDDATRVQLIVGTQWGDEGKGKIVDLLGEEADIVARYQGGPNAGHTVQFGNEKFILHQIPSGIFHPHTICVLGNGVVINPVSFLEEINSLESKGISVCNRLWISASAHLIFPYHQVLDQMGEEEEGEQKIGTTGRGIGPAYADKIARTGIRVGLLLDPKGWEAKILHAVRVKNQILAKLYGSPGVDENHVIDSLRKFVRRLRGCIRDVSFSLETARREGKRILLEGAQGTLLDIDFGTYPFVTSSNTTVGGACTGLGLNPRVIDRVIGVLKSYTTRVGNGPFPTELRDEIGEFIRKFGAEFGATTGRPRRCGWFDAVIGRYAVRINGIDALAMMKLDVLDHLDEIRICTAYRYENQVLEEFPPFLHVLEAVEPVYEVLPGWKTSTFGITQYEELPINARRYIERIEALLQTPIRILSTSADREGTIWR